MSDQGPLTDIDPGAFDLPIATDPEDIRAEQEQEMRLRIPTWRPVPGAFDTHILAAQATATAEGRSALTARVRTELLDLLGTLFGIPRHLGLGAASTMTVEAIDTTGHTLPAFTTVWLGDTELHTLAELVIPADETEGVVAVQALIPGTALNGATGTLATDGIDWLAAGSPILDAPLSDGTDTETDVPYSYRLAEELQLLSPRPIRARDYATLARRHPAVTYAWAINLYDASTGLSNQERTVTVIVADAVGQPVPSLARDEIKADLEDRSIAQMTVRVVSPTYVPIDVTAAIVVESGWEDATAVTNAEVRLETSVTPAAWLQPRTGGLDPFYVPLPIVHKNELVARADEAAGLEYVDELTVGDGSTDAISLGGPIALPEPGTITVTVAA